MVCEKSLCVSRSPYKHHKGFVPGISAKNKSLPCTCMSIKEMTVTISVKLINNWWPAAQVIMKKTIVDYIFTNKGNGVQCWSGKLVMQVNSTIIYLVIVMMSLLGKDLPFLAINTFCQYLFHNC